MADKYFIENFEDMVRQFGSEGTKTIHLPNGKYYLEEIIHIPDDWQFNSEAGVQFLVAETA